MKHGPALGLTECSHLVQETIYCNTVGDFFNWVHKKENVLFYRDNSYPRHPSFFHMLTSLSSSI